MSHALLQFLLKVFVISSVYVHIAFDQSVFLLICGISVIAMLTKLNV